MKTKLLLGILLLLSWGGAGWAQVSRDVHWIHGVGGDADSWKPAADVFWGERRINTAVRDEYNSGNGVATMATGVRTASQNVAGPNLIGIAHSMGGMASRHIDVNNTGHFGAIVTFGSPLRGARIVNAVSSGEAEDYIANGISKLNRGPFAQLLIFMPQILGIDMSDWFANHIVRGIAGSLSLRNETIPDLSEESGYNQSFYGNATPTPKLFMWGDEDSPVHVRLAATFSTIRVPWWLFPLPPHPAFTISVSEGTAVDLWNGTRYYYGFMEDYNRTLGYMPWAFVERWRSREWAAGHEYMFSQSEGQWRAMTGASFVQSFPVSFWGPIPGTTEEDLWYCADNNLTDENCPYYQQYSYMAQIFLNTPTDGVVPVRSAIAEGTAWRPDDPNRIRRLGGDNHQSMRSSGQGIGELRNAFNQVYGPAFAIDTR